METLNFLSQGFGVALMPTNLMMAAMGALIGTIVGMLPGLGPINGVALLMPLAFSMKAALEGANACTSPRSMAAALSWLNAVT